MEIEIGYNYDVVINKKIVLNDALQGHVLYVLDNNNVLSLTSTDGAVSKEIDNDKITISTDDGIVTLSAIDFDTLRESIKQASTSKWAKEVLDYEKSEGDEFINTYNDPDDDIDDYEYDDDETDYEDESDEDFDDYDSEDEY